MLRRVGGLGGEPVLQFAVLGLCAVQRFLKFGQFLFQRFLRIGQGNAVLCGLLACFTFVEIAAVAVIGIVGIAGIGLFALVLLEQLPAFCAPRAVVVQIALEWFDHAIGNQPKIIHTVRKQTAVM